MLISYTVSRDIVNFLLISLDRTSCAHQDIETMGGAAARDIDSSNCNLLVFRSNRLRT